MSFKVPEYLALILNDLDARFNNLNTSMIIFPSIGLEVSVCLRLGYKPIFVRSFIHSLVFKSCYFLAQKLKFVYEFLGSRGVCCELQGLSKTLQTYAHRRSLPVAQS